MVAIVPTQLQMRMHIIIDIDVFLMVENHVYHTVPINVRKVYQRNVFTRALEIIFVVVLLFREKAIRLLKAVHLLLVEYLLNVDFIIIMILWKCACLDFSLLLDEDVRHAVSIQINE